MNVPKVTRIAERAPVGDFPLKHYSYSTFVKFSTNPIMFKINYLNGESIEATKGVSQVVGQAFHTAMEHYFGDDQEFALKEGLEAGTAFIEAYPEGFIEWSKTIPNRQSAMERFTNAYTWYVQEKGRQEGSSLIECEAMIEEDIDVEWRGQRISLPVRLKGYIDRINRVNGKIVITDYKTCSSFSDPEKIDGGKIIQAITYFFLCFAKYGEAPYSVIFEEVKSTKNRDGGPQVREYEIVYSENEYFFDFWLRMYNDVTRAINGEMVYVPNIGTMFDNEVSIISYIHRLDVSEEAAKQMAALKVTSITELLKAKIEDAGNMRQLMVDVEKKFALAESIKYEDMEIHERIQTKLLEHGMIIKYMDKVVGCSVTLYRYAPSIGLKMKKLEGYVADIQQVVGKSGVRILAPIPNSTYIGFEVPNDVRTFPSFLSSPQGYELMMGVDIYGETFRFDITKAPHMLVAGATGSGKSVFLNSIISQLMHLDHTEIILMDPKLVELSRFRNSPNVTGYYDKTEDIYLALDDLVKRMNDRYEVMSKGGTRSVDEMPDAIRKFVIIDEFGDLALSNETAKGSKKSEDLNLSKEITRNVLILAQKARAAGIHIILATQRPSVDIITGSIKANFPTKVAFRTAKAVDSQVLLDHSGAEQLLGKGDMLFSSDEGEVRLQGFSI